EGEGGGEQYVVEVHVQRREKSASVKDKIGRGRGRRRSQVIRLQGLAGEHGEDGQREADGGLAVAVQLGVLHLVIQVERECAARRAEPGRHRRRLAGRRIETGDVLDRRRDGLLHRTGEETRGDLNAHVRVRGNDCGRRQPALQFFEARPSGG